MTEERDRTEELSDAAPDEELAAVVDDARDEDGDAGATDEGRGTETADVETDGGSADGTSTDDQLAAVEAERDEYLDHLRRTQAEFQNFRKRTMREGAAQREQGQVEVLTRLIDVLDDFELAVLAAESATDVESLRRGVEMVYGKLVDAVRSFGLEKIGLEGVPFDPERHEAVQSVESEEPIDEPVVVEVMRPGYEANGRVVRAAMVKVAK